MEEVAILGAGELGGLVAHILARRNAVHTIRLIDAVGSIAAGKALDIMQASPIEGFATRVVGSTDLASAASVAIIVLADSAGGGEWQGDQGLLVLKRVAEFARHRVTLCAGASQREIVERGVRELGFRRQHLFGSAPESLASAMRALVALESHGSARDVTLSVLGIPPAQTVISWEDATVGGFSSTHVLDEPTRRRLSSKLPALWPPGPYSLATAAAEAVAAITGRSRKTLSCFVAPNDSGGRRARAAALPVRLGRDGVRRVETPTLSASAQVALDNAMQL